MSVLWQKSNLLLLLIILIFLITPIILIIHLLKIFRKSTKKSLNRKINRVEKNNKIF